MSTSCSGSSSDRAAAAWAALQALAAEDALVRRLGARQPPRHRRARRGPLAVHLRRATTWSIYRAWAAGDAVVGPEQATRLTFWELGTSGKHEMIGVRGQSRFDIRSAPTVETIDGRDYPGRTAFPVGDGLERFHGEVDVVYTWVDGSDERWRAAFDEWSASRGP